jgi:hypothetical protein
MVLVVLLVFIREVKLDEELTFPFALHNVDFGLLTRSEYIPALDKLFNPFDVSLVPNYLVDFINAVLVKERRIEPDLLLGTVLEFEQILLLVWKLSHRY